MSIEIDSRERKYEKMLEYLADILPDNVEFTIPRGGLDHGADYIVRNKSELGIQRKTMNDFSGSIGDGLKGTMSDLRQNYEHSALLLEGSWKIAGGSLTLRRGGSMVQVMPLSSFHNFILSQQLRGSHVYHTANLKETSYALRDYHSYLDGTISPSRSVDDPEEMLALFPNIGPKKAERLVEKFGNVHYALNQFPNNWDRVDGIGQATVDDIDAWLRGEHD